MEFYDRLGGQYDLMIDWESRLEYEAPFFERIFSDLRAGSVLDAGCGTGRHAVLYSELGLSAAGFDPSAEMVRLANEYAHRKGRPVTFKHADFGEMDRVFKGKFDIVTCIGNTLPHLLTEDDLTAALGRMLKVTKKGGALIVQNRNYDKICRQKIRFAPAGHSNTGDEDVIFLRITEFHPRKLVFSILTLRRKKGGEAWETTSVSTDLRPWKKCQLESALEEAGYSHMDFYGNYVLDPYRQYESNDLIAVARK
jgi:glycine/sarcosine N-methyltransferase